MKMTHNILAAVLLLLPACGLLRVQGGTPQEKPAFVHLAEFGPLSTPAQMKAAYEEAIKQLSRAGGMLVIPHHAARLLRIENTTQLSPRTPAPPAETEQWDKAGVGLTIIEVTETGTVVKVPQVAGLTLERTLRMPARESLPHWSTDFALNLKNHVIHGSNSYLDWLSEPVEAGEDARFYVPSIRGLRPGMFLNLHAGPGYSGQVTRGCVNTLAYDPDKRMHYFTADTGIDHVAGAIVHNKNNTGVLYMEQTANADEQTYDVMLQRKQYALGDTYMFFGWYDYMSNIHSASGDENGNIFGGYTRSLARAFAGTVESVDWTTNTLVFAEGAQQVETLGQSRPLINMNPAKWVTQGKVMIVPAESYWDTVNTGKYPFRGTTYPTTLVKDPQTGVTGLRMGGLIRGDQDCPWDQRVVGRWFGITEPSELEPTERKIRWYEILSCTVNPDGTKDLTIQRFWWGAKEMGSPTLYRLEHGSWDGHLRPLSYAIAPGSYVTDVSKAVPTAAYAGERTLGIAPYAQAQSAVDFAPGDRIEQAIGADPFKPTAFRIWCWDQVPGAFPAPMLDLANFGADPRYAAMVVSGGPRHRDALPQTQRQMPAWEHIISVETAAGVGLNLEGDFTNAAILFQQPYHEQPLKWLYGPREPGKPVAEAVLTVSREHGDLTFTGGDVYVNGTVHARGFVGAEAAPRNSCGKDVAVQARATTITITFPQPEPDAHYVVTVEQNWLTERAITEKTATGFTVRFARPAPRGAKLDWVLRR